MMLSFKGELPHIEAKISFCHCKKKMKFSIKDFFSKYDQIRRHLLKKPLIENFIFCAVRDEGVAALTNLSSDL